MRVYTYSVGELSAAGIGIHGAVGFWLVNAAPVSDPARAQVFVSPAPLSDIPGRASMELMPHFIAYEARHVFLDISDCRHDYGNTSALLIRCNLTDHMRHLDNRSIAWPWPAEDFGENDSVLPFPEGGFRFDVSFRGCVQTGIYALRTSTARGEAVASCRTVLGERFDLADYSGFFGRTADGERAQQRHEYVTAMRYSRLMLCPESDVGAIPYRFYEALSAGRPPVLFCSGCLLPWANEIPWHDIAFFYPSAESTRAGEIVADIVSHHSDDELRERGRLGREWWSKLLAPARWNELLTQVIERDFAQRGLA